MMKLKCMGFLLFVFSVTACAPVHYQATRLQTPVYASHSNNFYQSKASHAYYSPIQITLYATAAYAGTGFQPVYLVIADGEYVEIPARNRNGRSAMIFAHYAQGSLHFDANRNCQRIHGSSGYKYDNRWEHGYGYTHINAGNDYDFNGLRLQIRNLPNSGRQATQKPIAKVYPGDRKTAKTSEKQSFKKQQAGSFVEQNEALNNSRVVDKRPEKSADHARKANGWQRSKAQEPKIPFEKARRYRTEQRLAPPRIIQEIANHDRRVIDEKPSNKHEPDKRSYQFNDKNAQTPKKAVIEYKTNDRQANQQQQMSGKNKVHLHEKRLEAEESNSAANKKEATQVSNRGAKTHSGKTGNDSSEPVDRSHKQAKDNSVQTRKAH